MKKTKGEILDVNEIREKDPCNVKNYGEALGSGRLGVTCPLPPTTEAAIKPSCQGLKF